MASPQTSPARAAPSAAPSLAPPRGVSANDALADPLLGCLENLARYYDRAIPRQALVAGLPLVDGKLTPRLFARAAARAGLSAKVARRPIAKLSSLVLPAVLILRDEGAVVLLEVYKNGHAQILIPETGAGVGSVKLTELEERYSGYAILLKPEYRFGEASRERPLARSEHWFWGAVKPLWPTYAQVMLVASIVNLLALAAPLFIMNVYDRVLPNKAIPTLWVLAIGITLAISFDFVLRTLRNGLIGNAGRRADAILASRIFAHVLNIDLANRPMKTGEFANYLKDFEVVREFFTSNTLVTVTDLLFIGLFILIIFQIAGMVAIVPAVAVILVIVVGILIQYPLSNIVRRSQSEAAHRHSILIEVIGSLDTIKCARAESQMQRQWEQLVGQNSRTSENLRFISALGLNFSAMIQQLVSVGVVVLGVYMFEQGDVSPGAIIAAVILAGRAVGPLGQIAGTIARSQQAFHSLRMLDRIMAVPEEGEGQERHIDRTAQTGAVVFDKVTFKYPESDAPALNAFSLEIRPGDRIGIIGKIGSGKTTVGRLMSRLYVPTAGSLLLDGVDIRQYHPSEIRRAVAFVAQDTNLFHGTVRDNIVLGAPYVSDDLVVRAALVAGVTEFVKLHPHGFNMAVGEGGRLLSSGQRHAVALARAFLFDPLVVFLDEPSGSMDMASERALIERLRTAFRPDQTVILTTHRYNMLSLINRLVVIDSGQVVADGPRDEVMKALTGKAESQAVTVANTIAKAGPQA